MPRSNSSAPELGQPAVGLVLLAVQPARHRQRVARRRGTARAPRRGSPPSGASSAAARPPRPRGRRRAPCRTRRPGRSPARRARPACGCSRPPASTVSQRIQRSASGSARWSSTSSAPSSKRSGSTAAPSVPVLMGSKLLRAQGVEVLVDELGLAPGAQRARLERGLDGEPVDNSHGQRRRRCSPRPRGPRPRLCASSRRSATRPRQARYVSRCARASAGRVSASPRNANHTRTSACRSASRGSPSTSQARASSSGSSVRSSAAASRRPHAVRHRPEREQQQLLLVGEVVDDGAGGPARLFRDAPDRHGLEPLAGRQPPHRRRRARRGAPRDLRPLASRS